MACLLYKVATWTIKQIDQTKTYQRKKKALTQGAKEKEVPLPHF